MKMKISRRELLSGAAISSLALGISPAAARFPRGSSLANRIARATINAFTGEPWALQNFAQAGGSGVLGGSTGWQAQVNDDGYPNGPVVNSFGYAVSLTSHLIDPSIVWVIKWTGKGGLLLNAGGTYGMTVTAATGTNVSPSSLPSHNSNNTALSGTNCYFELNFDANALQLSINFTSNFVYDGTMSNLVICRKSDYNASTGQTNGTFTPEFLAMLGTGGTVNGTSVAGLNPKIIRFMDWPQTNSSLVSRFAYRHASTALSYTNQRYVAALWGGTTGGTSTAYTCANPSGSPSSGAYVDGETVQVIFNATNTSATPTLALAGRSGGAVTITTDYVSTLGTGGSASIQSGAYATLVYDAWLNVWLAQFGFPSSNNAAGGLNAAIPIEVIVQLCNQTNSNLWYCFPFLYGDADITAATQYIRDNLNSNLIAYLEFSNEVWNTVMHQTFVSQARGAYLGFPNSSARQVYGYYGLRVRQVMANVTTSWAPRSMSTLRRVLANWMADADPVDQSQASRMNGTDLAPFTTSITGISASATTPTITATNSYSQTQKIVPSGITGTGAISALNGQTLVVLNPTASNFVIGTEAWSGSGYFSGSGTTFNIVSGSGTLAIGQYLDGGFNPGVIITGGSGAAWTVNTAPSNLGSLGQPLGIAAFSPVSTAGGTYSSGGSTSSLYSALGNASYNAGSPTFSRPIDFCDAIAYAPYFAGPSLGGNSGDLSSLNTTDVGLLQAAADAFATGNPTQMAAALAWVDDDIRKGTTGKQAVTVSGGNTFTVSGSAPSAGTAIAFYTVGTAFTGLTYTNLYYVINPSGGTFQVSTTPGGSAVTGISGGSGTQYFGSSGGETLLWNRTHYYATSNTQNYGYAQIAASYNGVRPSGLSNLEIACYEGGLENLVPSVNQCNSAAGGTLTGSVYGGTGGRIDLMLNGPSGYKYSALAYQLVLDFFNDLVSVSNTEGVSVVTPAWYGLNTTNGYPNQWALLTGDTFTTPYTQLYAGFAAYNT